jgi:hypothetical protein
LLYHCPLFYQGGLHGRVTDKRVVTAFFITGQRVFRHFGARCILVFKHGYFTCFNAPGVVYDAVIKRFGI